MLQNIAWIHSVFITLLVSTEIASVDQSTAANCGHSSSSSQSLTPAAAGIGSTPSSMSSSSSSSSVQAPPSAQLPSPALLQDPALLHQLLPALQATLQMNNGSMDVAKLNEGEDEGAVYTAYRSSVLFSTEVHNWFSELYYGLFATS